MDSDGALLALVGERTVSVARVVATQLHDGPFPLRLCYAGSVLRNQALNAGRRRESLQAGCELVGASGLDADAECIALAAAALEQRRCRRASRSTSAMPTSFPGCSSSAGLDRAREEVLAALASRDLVAVESALRRHRRGGCGAASAARISDTSRRSRDPRHRRGRTARRTPASRAPGAGAALGPARRARDHRPCAPRPRRGSRLGLLHRTDLRGVQRGLRASRWGPVGATTRCSRVSAQRCRRPASCSTSTAVMTAWPPRGHGDEPGLRCRSAGRPMCTQMRWSWRAAFASAVLRAPAIWQQVVTVMLRVSASRRALVAPADARSRARIDAAVAALVSRTP